MNAEKDENSELQNEEQSNNSSKEQSTEIEQKPEVDDTSEKASLTKKTEGKDNSLEDIEEKSKDSSEDQESNLSEGSQIEGAKAKVSENPVEAVEGTQKIQEAKAEENKQKTKEVAQDKVPSEVEVDLNKTEVLAQPIPDGTEEEYEFTEDEEEEHHDEDYEKLSLEELIDRIKEITGKDISQISEKKIEAIREAFFHQIDLDKDAALQDFLKEEDNSEEDFEYLKGNELIQQFNSYYHGYKDQRKRVHIDHIKLKEENHKKKEELLERLRQFVDEEEDNVGINVLKEIEDEWKKAEPIPNNFARELWANFNALRDRFYDKRSIFFELKELDRKKNLKLKQEVIAKAKELIEMNPVNQAVAELKKLHEEYKHIGPVPQELRSKLWENFREISDKIHERKQVVAAEFKVKLDENLERKKELIKQLESYMEFGSEKISEWNEKSREVLNIQENWKKIGPVPRELAKEISKSFWSHFKGFFKNKQQFFKVLDEQRDQNFEAKVKLCEEVESLNASEEDLSQHTNQVKQLQRKWKEIGPAPRKKSEEVYKRFKDACDVFFNHLRGHQKELEKDYDENLVKKNEIVEKLKAFKELTEANLEEAESLIKEWLEAGFVPKKAIKYSKNSIDEAIDGLLKKAKDFTAHSKEIAETKMKALLMKGDFHGSRNIGDEMDKIRHQITKLQDENVTLKTNMEFFASTKNADKLKVDIQKKIDVAEEHIQNLKNKIKVLRQIDK